MSGITLKDIYDVVNRLEDKFDGRFSGVEKEVEQIGLRVGTVEKLFSNMAGKVTMGVVIVGTIVGIISDIVVNFFRGLRS